MSLKTLEGKGWMIVEPPREDDPSNVIARYDGEPIRAGLLRERITDTDEMFEACYRSGPFDVRIKVDFSIGVGQIRVDRAEGYGQS